jgi:Cu/Ag efflux pump CusA
VVRFPESARRDVAELERLLVAAPGRRAGAAGPAGGLSVVEAPAQVSRENGMRRVVAEVNVRGRDLGGFVAEVQERLAPLAASNCLRATAWSTAGSSRTSSAPCASWRSWCRSPCC